MVLPDLNLPEMDGLEPAKEMRKTKNTPIIMTTARVNEVDRDRSGFCFHAKLHRACFAKLLPANFCFFGREVSASVI